MTTTPPAEPVTMDGVGQLVGDDGQLIPVYVHIEGEIVRGPLGRFIDLAQQIEEEGGEVPAPLKAVLIELQQPQETS